MEWEEVEYEANSVGPSDPTHPHPVAEAAGKSYILLVQVFFNNVLMLQI